MDNPQTEKEKALWRQQKHLEIKEELRNSETLKKFLEKAYPNSFNDFIDSYASKKVSWLEWGAKFIEWNEATDTKWLDEAKKRLEEIQQKKLFDYQCQWRAEKIENKQIRTTFDFNYWEDNILNCPFIEPITQSDVELYLRYLQSNNFEYERGFLSRWQDYNGIKKANNDEFSFTTFPEWYEFHNNNKGLSFYLLLPNIREEKENFYIKLWADEQNANAKKEIQLQKQITEILPGPIQETKPNFDYFKKGWMTWFVNTFDDKDTQDSFKKYGGERAFSDYDDFMENDLDLLADSDRIIPIEGWFDWKEALHKAADKYRLERIQEAMPAAYEQYRIHIDMNLSFPEGRNIFKLHDYYHDAILRGRELNGEPMDFNF